jgi:hypothetical protein
VSGSLNVAPIGTTSSTAQVDKVDPRGAKQQNSGVRVWGEKHARIPGLDSCESASKIVAQMKEDIQVLVPETAKGFRASIGALMSLN